MMPQGTWHDGVYNSDGNPLPSEQAEPKKQPEVHAGQILEGAKAISEYMRVLGFDMTEKRVFHWAADDRIPAKKIGNRLIANKRAILRHYGLE